MNQLVLKHLEPAAWPAQLSGSRGRTLAAIFSHMHNIRRKWLRLSAPPIRLPAPLDGSRCMQKEAAAALAESAARCCEMLGDPSLQFHRDGWTKPWRTNPAKAAAYMISHEAMWAWERRM
jgi:hypothetical protein